VLKNAASSLYLIVAKGFVAAKNLATRLSSEEASDAAGCAAKFGIEVSTEEVSGSFAVGYIRPSDVKDGAVASNDKNPSRRRFATIEEARTHGARYYVRRAKSAKGEKKKPVGSAGHIGYYIIETGDPVTDAVNPKTGLTNKL